MDLDTYRQVSEAFAHARTFWDAIAPYVLGRDDMLRFNCIVTTLVATSNDLIARLNIAAHFYDLRRLLPHPTQHLPADTQIPRLLYPPRHNRHRTVTPPSTPDPNNTWGPDNQDIPWGPIPDDWGMDNGWTTTTEEPAGDINVNTPCVQQMLLEIGQELLDNGTLIPPPPEYEPPQVNPLTFGDDTDLI